MTFEKLVNKWGITFEHTFVPFSVSRNSKADYKSLNWKINLCGREFDYQQGCAHAPAYKRKWEGSGQLQTAIDAECEKGLKVKGFDWTGRMPLMSRDRIAPDYKSFLYCLYSDSDALNYTGFEDWCDNLGFDSDSIKAKKAYDDCVSTGLYFMGLFGRGFFDDCEKCFEDY